MRHYRNLIGIFLTVALVIAVCIITIFVTGLRGRKTTRDMQAHLATIERLDDFLLTLTTAETGQRGYLLTGDSSYLKPYQSAVPQVTNEIKDLEASAQLPQQDIGILQQASQAKLDELSQTIHLRQAQGPAAALAKVQTNLGENLMDKIRAAILTARDTEQTELTDASIRHDFILQTRNVIYILTGAVILAFLGWAYTRISREKSHREAAYGALAREREEVQRQKEFLNVTLGSIGDCVIVADTEGRITFMNPVAATVTGWSREEALNQPVERIFRIINEETREPGEHPVVKVLKTEKIAGLPNHTLLIRKDGSEVPIDDSGAPICEPSGELRGVVLVFRDFSDHKKVETELIRAKSEAEAASKAKDQFLAMLSHELRTPLAPVLATLNRWEFTGELPAAVQAEVQMVRRGVELEARIIDDLLDLTRIAKGMLSLTPEPINVHTLIEPLAGMYRSEIAAKHLYLDLRLAAAHPYVNLDGTRLQQVMWNILRNAAKFTPRGGRITIETANDGKDRLVISVTDTGIGMDQGTLSRLFIPFEQGEKDLSRRYGGLGLGLAISRALVDLLGGEISANSDGPGKGARFVVAFPSIEVDPASTAKFEDLDVTGPERARLRILLVEDHPDTGAAMSRLLEARGHQVSLATDVSTGIEMIDHDKFDLVLCDLGLPDGTGLDVVAHLRKRRDTPAIALSGFGMEEDLTRCLEAGFDLHLMKPVNLKQLELGIVRLIKKNAA